MFQFLVIGLVLIVLPHRKQKKRQPFFYLHGMKNKKRWFFLLSILAVNLPVLAQKPNILWITIEDTSPQFIGCYGNAAARTPTIDRLANEGVRFTHAFSTGTVCSPSRSTIITGVETGEMGTGDHRSRYPIPSFIKGFPWYLREAGYYTTNHVKTDYNTSAQPRLIKEAWDESSKTAGWWNRKPGQPFFAVFNFMDSHQSRTMTWPYEKYRNEVLDKLAPGDRIGPDDFAVPPFYRDDSLMRKQLARVYNALKLTDQKIGVLLKSLQRDHLMDSTIIFFYGDHGEGIPRGKTNGIGLGYRVPFAIWFPPMYRHLSPWGTGVVTDECTNFEDLAPTLLSLAGVAIPDYMKGRALLGSQRTDAPRFIFGSTDRSDESTDLERSVISGRYVYNRNFMAYLPAMRWMQYQEVADIKKQMRADYKEGVLDSAQSRLFAPRPPESLYDLYQDPWEMHNLIADPALQPLLDSMRQALTTHLLQTRDIAFLPEYDRALLSRQQTPYAYRQTDHYPIKKIYAAAALSGKRGAAVLAKQLALLQKGDSVVRYWALIGIRAQPDSLLRPYREILQAAVNDSYPLASITAAALCYELFDDDQAATVLKRYCENNNPQLALYALQNIAYFADLRPFSAVIRFVHAGKGAKDAYNLQAITDVLMERLAVSNKEP